MKQTTAVRIVAILFGALVLSWSLHEVYILRQTVVSLTQTLASLTGNKCMVERPEALQWKLDLLQARPYKGMSPTQLRFLSADCIPDETLSQMGTFYDGKIRNWVNKSEVIAKRKEATPLEMRGQIGGGEFVVNTMTFVDGRPVWTGNIWRHLKQRLKSRKVIGPPGYKHSHTDVSKALRYYRQHLMPKHKGTLKAAVFSSMSPWMEAIISHELERVTVSTVDYNPCVLKDIPQEELDACIHVRDMYARGGSSFDLIASYSGIEHDGLGRYGDPVNPNGDISAVLEMWCHLHVGGLLLLAVPVGPPDEFKYQSGVKLFQQTIGTDRGVFIDIYGDGKGLRLLRHRLYGPQRLAQLMTGFDFLGWVVHGRMQLVLDSMKGMALAEHRTLFGNTSNRRTMLGDHQPLLMLRKRAGVTMDSLLRAHKMLAEHH